MNKTTVIATFFSAALCLLALRSHLIVQQPEKLVLVEVKVEQEFPKIKHADPHLIATMIENNDASTVLIDVREADEFAVSRIPGAVRISPDAQPENMLSLIGNLAGKTLVFYCSVGYRSSKLATTAQSILKAQGAREIINLRGGIFAWHNARLPLRNDRSATKLVHPYNERWAQYLKYRNLSRMKDEEGTHTD